MFLIFHVTSCEHMFEGLCELWWKPITVSHHLARFDGHYSSASGYTNYLTCHVTLQNHMIEGSSNLMSGSSSWCITTLPSLATVGVAVVEI